MKKKKTPRTPRRPKPRKPPNRLSTRQAAFVHEYQVDQNGKQAAIRAGYAVKGAEVIASNLLTNAKVAAALGAALSKKIQATELTAKHVLDRLIEVGFSEITWDKIRPEHQLRAIEILAKYLGMLTEHVRIQRASGLTEAEEARIAAFSDGELAEFRQASETLDRLLHDEPALEGTVH